MGSCGSTRTEYHVYYYIRERSWEKFCPQKKTELLNATRRGARQVETITDTTEDAIFEPKF